MTAYLEVYVQLLLPPLFVFDSQLIRVKIIALTAFLLFFSFSL